jgi:hypothetical protein
MPRSKPAQAPERALACISPSTCEAFYKTGNGNGFYDCHGVLVAADASDGGWGSHLAYEPGPGLRCNATLEDEFSGNGLLAKVLKACEAGDQCRIKGWIQGHGTYSWTKILSVVRERDTPLPRPDPRPKPKSRKPRPTAEPECG